ncbi:MAG: hypothetical protein D6769_03670 [Methanobacteriota archaeon]|nr:MAG: hypothetical protein D6769_03670 [Euryarchaeota archaeon]
MEMQLKTGIQKLDRALGGGIMEGTITAITGPTGIGKSTLSMQFLINGIKQGDRGLYIPMEHTKETAHSTFSSYAWSIQEYEELGTLLFIDYPFHEIEQFVSQSNPLKEIIEKYDINRVVVDSWLPIASSVTSKEERSSLFAKAFDKMREWGTSVFVIAEGDQPIIEEFASSYWHVESFADNWIEMRYNLENNTREMRVVKQRGQKNDLELMEFSIGKTGITI